MSYVVRVISQQPLCTTFVYELMPTTYCLCSAAKGMTVLYVTPTLKVSHSLVFESTVDTNKSSTPDDIFRAPGWRSYVIKCVIGTGDVRHYCLDSPTANFV